MNVKTNFFPNQDCLLIEQAEVSCRVGETAKERAFPQIIYVSAQMMLSLKQAGHKDNLNLTVDYMKIIHSLKKHLGQQQFALIESIAESVAYIILQHKYVQEVSVKITKKVAPGVASVSACVHRTR